MKEDTYSAAEGGVGKGEIAGEFDEAEFGVEVNGGAIEGVGEVIDFGGSLGNPVETLLRQFGADALATMGDGDGDASEVPAGRGDVGRGAWRGREVTGAGEGDPLGVGERRDEQQPGWRMDGLLLDDLGEEAGDAIRVGLAFALVEERGDGWLIAGTSRADRKVRRGRAALSGVRVVIGEIMAHLRDCHLAWRAMRRLLSIRW